MNEHTRPGLRLPSSFVTFRLARLQNSLNAQAIALLKSRAGLSLVEWRLIQILRIYGSASLTEAAGHMQMDKGQLSRKVKAMVDKGLLRVEGDDKDHRVQKLHLTEKAEDLSQQMMPTMEARQDLLLSEVSAEDLATFYSVLEKIEAASKARNIE